MAEEQEKEKNEQAMNQEENTPGTEMETANPTDEDISSLVREDSQNTNAVLNKNLEILFDLELPVSVELARKDMIIRDILALGEGSIIEFDKMAGEEADVLVNGKKVATGEVVVIDDRFGVRITSLIDPADRLKGITD